MATYVWDAPKAHNQGPAEQLGKRRQRHSLESSTDQRSFHTPRGRTKLGAKATVRASGGQDPGKGCTSATPACSCRLGTCGSCEGSRAAGREHEHPCFPKRTFPEHAPPDWGLKAEVQPGSGRATALGTAASSPGTNAARGCHPAPVAPLPHQPSPASMLGTGCPGTALWHGAGRQGEPQGDPVPACSPCASIASPLLAQKMPLKQPQPLYTAPWGICPPAQAVVLLTLPCPAAQPASAPDPLLPC